MARSNKKVDLQFRKTPKTIASKFYAHGLKKYLMQRYVGCLCKFHIYSDGKVMSCFEYIPIEVLALPVFNPDL